MSQHDVIISALMDIKEDTGAIKSEIIGLRKADEDFDVRVKSLETWRAGQSRPSHYSRGNDTEPIAVTFFQSHKRAIIYGIVTLVSIGSVVGGLLRAFWGG